MPKIVIYRVTGMHCRSCEKLISDVLKDVPGVIETEVSLKQGRAAVRVRDEARDPDLALVNRQLSAHGYELFPQGCRLPASGGSYFRRLRRALVALVGVGLFVVCLWPLVRGFFPAVTAAASISALFVFGLLASVSSCLATTGGFMLAYSAEVGSGRKTLLMHLGRLFAFVLGGAVLGALGRALPQISPTWFAVVAIVLGCGFLGVALNLLGLSPSWARLGFALPSSLSSFAEDLKKRPGGITPFLVGTVTFVLPCGFTQTAQALALASGSALKGALFLAAFVLGTLPVLLGMTLFAAKAKLKDGLLQLVAGAVMLFFALDQIGSGLSLLGVPVSLSAGTPTAVPSSGPAAEQVVRMKITSSGYSPQALTVRLGLPVRWEIDATQAGGCTGSIVSRELGINKILEPGLNTLTFTPNRTGAIAFSCGMGMVRGTFNVIE